MTTPTPPAVKPGYTTTEFWLTLLGPVIALITVIFHHDFSGYVQVGAAVAAAVGGAVYAITRSGVKREALALLHDATSKKG